MTKIVMLQTRRGSEDGFGTEEFFKGACYDVRDNMACRFICDGFAVAAAIWIPNIVSRPPLITRFSRLKGAV